MTGVQTCALPICFPVTIEDYSVFLKALVRVLFDQAGVTDVQIKALLKSLSEQIGITDYKSVARHL